MICWPTKSVVRDAIPAETAAINTSLAYSPLDMTRSLPSRQATARNAPFGATAIDATPPQPAGKAWSVAPWSSMTHTVSPTAANTCTATATAVQLVAHVHSLCRAGLDDCPAVWRVESPTMLALTTVAGASLDCTNLHKAELPAGCLHPCLRPVSSSVSCLSLHGNSATCTAVH